MNAGKSLVAIGTLIMCCSPVVACWVIDSLPRPESVLVGVVVGVFVALGGFATFNRGIGS